MKNELLVLSCILGLFFCDFIEASKSDDDYEYDSFKESTKRTNAALKQLGVHSSNNNQEAVKDSKRLHRRTSSMSSFVPPLKASSSGNDDNIPLGKVAKKSNREAMTSGDDNILKEQHGSSHRHRKKLLASAKIESSGSAVSDNVLSVKHEKEEGNNRERRQREGKSHHAVPPTASSHKERQESDRIATVNKELSAPSNSDYDSFKESTKRTNGALEQLRVHTSSDNHEAVKAYKRLQRTSSMSSLTSPLQSNERGNYANFGKHSKASRRMAMTSDEDAGAASNRKHVRSREKQKEVLTSVVTTESFASVPDDVSSDFDQTKTTMSEESRHKVKKVPAEQTVLAPTVAVNKKQKPNMRKMLIQKMSGNSNSGMASSTENKDNKHTKPPQNADDSAYSKLTKQRSSSVGRPKTNHNNLGSASIKGNDKKNRSNSRTAMTSDDEETKTQKKEKDLMALFKDEEIKASCVSFAMMKSTVKKLDENKIGIKSFFREAGLGNDISISPYVMPYESVCLSEVKRICAWGKLLEKDGGVKQEEALKKFSGVMDLIPIVYSVFNLPRLNLSELDLEQVLSAVNSLVSSYESEDKRFSAIDCNSIDLGEIEERWGNCNERMNFFTMFNPSKSKSVVGFDLDRLERDLEENIYICTRQIQDALTTDKSEEDITGEFNRSLYRAIEDLSLDDEELKTSLIGDLREYVTSEMDKYEFRQSFSQGDYCGISLEEFCEKVDGVWIGCGDSTDTLVNTVTELGKDSDKFLNAVNGSLQDYQNKLSEYEEQQRERMNWMRQLGYILLYYAKSFVYSLTMVIPYYRQYLEEHFNKAE